MSQIMLLRKVSQPKDSPAAVSMLIPIGFEGYFTLLDEQEIPEGFIKIAGPFVYEDRLGLGLVLMESNEGTGGTNMGGN